MPIDPGDRDPDEVLRNGLRAFLTAVATEPDTWRPILLPPQSTPQALRERMLRTRERVARALEDVVSWGLRRRGFPEDTDVRLLTMTLMGLFEQAGRLVLNDPADYPPERFVGLAETLMASTRPPAQPARV